MSSSPYFASLVHLEAPRRGVEVVAQLLVSLGEIGWIPMTAIPGILRAVQRRELLGSTGIGHGIALPHARCEEVQKPIGIVGVSAVGVDYDSLDGNPADLFFLLLAPAGVRHQIHELQALVALLRDEEFLASLRAAGSPQSIRQWLASTNARIFSRPEPMEIPSPPPPIVAVTLRAARRFALSCSRLRESRPEQFVERVLDGQAAESELDPLRQRLEEDYQRAPANNVDAGLHLALVERNPHRSLSLALAAAWQLGLPLPEQAGRLADFFGPVGHSLDPAWLAWDDQAPGRVARSIHESGNYTDLPILADALEDAGCDDPVILNHLRGPGPHDCGCWVIGRILGGE